MKCGKLSEILEILLDYALGRMTASIKHVSPFDIICVKLGFSSIRFAIVLDLYVSFIKTINILID